MEPKTSWSIFDYCETCGVGPGKFCCDLKRSTSKKLVEAKLPHPKRKKLPFPYLECPVHNTQMLYSPYYMTYACIHVGCKYYHGVTLADIEAL